MRACIHRGSGEIGGNCVELEQDGFRIVLDVGRPLAAGRHQEVPLPDVPGLASGDALIQAEASVFFVMNFGRGADDAASTNALLIKEGVKSFSAGGGFKMVEAFSDVALSKEETDVLNRVAASFQKEAALLGQEISNLKYRDEFEGYKAMATDNSPFLEYQLAKAYLEGRGTEKNEPLGMDWMKRAASNGSGDARPYLESAGGKAP